MNENDNATTYIDPYANVAYMELSRIAWLTCITTTTTISRTFPCCTNEAERKDIFMLYHQPSSISVHSSPIPLPAQPQQLSVTTIQYIHLYSDSFLFITGREKNNDSTMKANLPIFFIQTAIHIYVPLAIPRSCQASTWSSSRGLFVSMLEFSCDVAI